MTYAPPREILERYASVLVDFALGGGQGISPGDVVRIVARESAKPLFIELNRAVWRSGGHVIGAYEPEDEPGMNLYVTSTRRPAMSNSTTFRVGICGVL